MIGRAVQNATSVAATTFAAVRCHNGGGGWFSSSNTGGGTSHSLTDFENSSNPATTPKDSCNPAVNRSIGRQTSTIIAAIANASMARHRVPAR